MNDLKIENQKKQNDLNNVAVELKAINFSYNESKPILTDVSFQIFEKEYVCIIGHNGSGKSTISKILVGLLQPQSGVIKVFEQEINYLNVKYLRENVGIIFQNPDSQFIGLTAEDDIAFGLENKKINPEYMKPIIDEIASLVDISHLLSKDSVSLSGGQKQRVAIASVLAMNPQIVIFDESTSMLDPMGKIELKQMMLKLKNESKKTIISITHDMDEVVNADKVIILEKGKIIKIGKPNEVFSDKQFLEKIALDFPFILKLSKQLKDKGINIKLTINKEEFLKELWKQTLSQKIV